MNLKSMLDWMYPKTSRNEQGEPTDGRTARFERIDSQMHAAWEDIHDNPVNLRSMDSWIFTSPASTDKRVRLIVEHLTEAIIDDRDYHAVDVSSSKLKFDQNGAFISVLTLNLGWLTPFRVSSTALPYIDPSAAGAALKVQP